MGKERKPANDVLPLATVQCYGKKEPAKIKPFFLSLLLWSLLYEAEPSGTSVLIKVPSSSGAAGKGGSGCSGLLRLIYKRSGSLRVMTDSSQPGLYFLLKNFLHSSALIPTGAQDLERLSN